MRDQMHDDEWFGPVSQIEIVEQSDGLLVRITQIRRKGHLAIALLITLFVGVLFAWHESWWGFFFVLGLGLFWIASWFSSRWGQIRVDENYLAADGKKPVRLAWVEIHRLQYRGGGEDEPSGFYARVGRWKSICVMTDLNREQTEEIIAAIHHRFPHLKMADEIEPISNRLRSWLEQLRGKKD
jgi:hypothetical protein